MTKGCQGKWVGMAKQYASNRVGFQASYALECFERTYKGPENPGRVVDVGCGTGEFARFLAARGADVVGLDISSEMVEYARSRGGRFETIDLSQNCLEESFDLGTSFMMLHWPREPARTRLVENVRRMCTTFCAGFHGEGSCREGVLAVEEASSTDITRLPSMFSRDSVEDWHLIFTNAGFRHVDITQRTIETTYDNIEGCRQRLDAAWPPILLPRHSPREISRILEVAAEIMYHKYDATMTSRVIEVNAS